MHTGIKALVLLAAMTLTFLNNPIGNWMLNRLWKRPTRKIWTTTSILSATAWLLIVITYEVWFICDGPIGALIDKL
jgi:predicted PurR-regulated permease PerM